MQKQMMPAIIRQPFRVPHFLWVLIVHILCTRVQCARAIEDCQRSGTSGGVRPAGAERRVAEVAVVVYWKKEEQEETAMANAIGFIHYTRSCKDPTG